MKIAEIKLRENWNLRQNAHEKIDTLAKSIKEIGLQNPIVINDKNQLVSGHRRLFACASLGMKEIDCLIMTFESELKERLAHIDENFERGSLNKKDQEKALAERKEIYAKLYPLSKRGGKNTPDSFEKNTAKLTNKSETAIRNDIARVNDVTKEVREAYENDQLTQTQVDALTKLPKEKQNDVLKKVRGASVAETNMLVQDELNKEKKGFKETQFINKLVKQLHLTNVQMKELITNQYYKIIDDDTFDSFAKELNETFRVIDEISSLVNEMVEDMGESIEYNDIDSSEQERLLNEFNEDKIIEV